MIRERMHLLGARAPSFLLNSSLRLVLFGGKGGVGKTTCAAAAALSLAARRPDASFQVVSIDPAHSLRDSFAGDGAPANLELLEVDAPADLDRFKAAHAGHLRQIALRGTFFDDEDISRLVDLSLPGLDEIMAFNDIASLVEEDRRACIIVDTAPTGHALRFMELPDLMRDWIDTLDAMLGKHRYMARLYRGLCRKDETDAFLEDLASRIGRLKTLLQDADRCRFVPVLTPDPLSIQETHDLLARLQGLRVPVDDVLVNRVCRPEAQCPSCLAAAGDQAAHLQAIGAEFAADHTLWQIPRLGAQLQGREALSALWASLSPFDPPEQRPGPAVAPPPRVLSPAPAPPAGLSVLLFAGKGGVGKTTLACATAIRLAEDLRPRQIILLSTDPAHSLSDCLQVPIGPRRTDVLPGLTAVELDARAEFAELKALYAEEVADFFQSVTSNGGVDLRFDREVIERLLHLSPPGLDEIMALTRVVDLLEADRRCAFVIDTAPTGHLVRLLELPELIDQWLKAIFGLLLKYRKVLHLPRITDFLVDLSKKIKRLRSLLTDQRKSRLCAVSIPTEMALAETRDLLAACGRSAIHVPGLFVNMVAPDGDCPACRAIAREEARILGDFKEAFPGLGRTVIFRCPALLGRERLAALGRALYRGNR